MAPPRGPGRADLLTACTLLAAATPAFAQKDFPSKPIMLVVTYPPGAHRRDGPHAGRRAEEQPRPAGGGGEPRWRRRQHRRGSRGRAEPDGYTLMFGTSAPLAINVSLYRKINYDPVKSFAPVIQIGHLPNVLVVNPACPRRTCRS
jgi:tripartite-type tricarboxylate transporter receptor subunit TctC